MGAKSKKSSKDKDSKKTSKKSSKKVSKEKDKSKSKSSKSKEKSSKKSKSPKSKNDSLIIKDEDLNEKKPELDTLNQNPNQINNLNMDNNKFFPTLDTNTNNPLIQIQNGAIFPPGQTPNLHTINPQNLISSQKCEGCFLADAVCFCKECGKAFCPSCDGQIHLVPIYKNHERVSINEMKHLKHLCVHHNLPLKLFCDSCNEPACDECKITGPHDTKLHNVKSIIEAYNEKYKILMNIT